MAKRDISESIANARALNKYLLEAASLGRTITSDEVVAMCQMNSMLLAIVETQKSLLDDFRAAQKVKEDVKQFVH